ncbi:hypothetical protein Tco_0846379 [Tanacetum coccineum]
MGGLWRGGVGARGEGGGGCKWGVGRWVVGAQLVEQGLREGWGGAAIIYAWGGDGGWLSLQRSVTLGLGYVGVLLNEGKDDRVMLAYGYGLKASREPFTKYRVHGPTICGGSWLELYPHTNHKHQVIEQLMARSGMDVKMAKTCYHSHCSSSLDDPQDFITMILKFRIHLCNEAEAETFIFLYVGMDALDYEKRMVIWWAGLIRGVVSIALSFKQFTNVTPAWTKDQVVLDPKATPPSTIQMIGENKTAPKLQSKRKNVYVSRDTMQKQARKKSQKSLNYCS